MPDAEMTKHHSSFTRSTFQRARNALSDIIKGIELSPNMVALVLFCFFNRLGHPASVDVSSEAANTGLNLQLSGDPG